MAPTRAGFNACRNPSFETNTTWVNLRAGTTAVVSAEQAWVGTNALKIVNGSVGQTTGVFMAPVFPNGLTGLRHTLATTCRLFVPAGQVVPRVLHQYGYAEGGGDLGSVDGITGTDTWQTLSLPPIRSDPTKTISTIFFQVTGITASSPAFTCYLDGVDHRYDEADVDDYIDGTLGSRYKWMGAVHNSQSYRDEWPAFGPGPGQNRTLVLFPAATRTTVGAYSPQLDVGPCGGMRFDLDLTAVTAPIGFNAEFWDPAKGAWSMVYSFTQQAAPGHYVSHLHPELPLSANVSYPVIPEKKCRVTFTGSGTYTGSLSCSLEAP